MSVARRGVMSPGRRTLGIRWHLLLGHLAVIWVALALLMLSLSRNLESTAFASRKAYLFAQAHLIASAVRARGGPRTARLSAIGGVPYQGRVLLLDGDGRVLEDSAADPDIMGKRLNLPEVTEALRGRESANTYYLPDGSFVMYAAVPSSWDSGGGVVFIAQDLKEVVSQHRSVMTMVITGGLLTSAAALVAAAVVSGFVAEPVRELARNAQRLAAGRLDVRVTPGGPQETRELGEAFNLMAEAVERMVGSHEQFLLAAAHELRSPLASLQVLVESMRMKTPSPEEFPGLLRDLESCVRVLVRISESFLDLLRAAREPSETREVPGSLLRDVVLEAFAARSSIVRGKMLSVEKAFRGVEGATVAMDPMLFRFVVSNLVDNAVKFTPAGGTVRVVLDAATGGPSGGGGTLLLEVADTGPGIPAEHIPRIFERFYRVDRARSRRTEGSGLGLAIAREACERSGGRIDVESRLGAGSTFRVTWPGVVVHTGTDR